MTIDEAVAAFEKDFTVHDWVPGGVPSIAPSGDRYITMTQGGIKPEGAQFSAYFTTEEAAAEAWLRHAWEYAETRPGKILYWRERPAYSDQEYVAVHQAALMNDSEWRTSMCITLGVVWSRFVISEEQKPKGKNKS